MILVCGRVCAGKTTYAKRLAREIGAVRLNADELMKPLFGEYLGNRHEEVLRQVTALLLEKATECYENGVNVILDLGFWQRGMREQAERFFEARGIRTQWHYLKIEDAEWKRRITKRNERILASGSETDYLIDENIIQKSNQGVGRACAHGNSRSSDYTPEQPGRRRGCLDPAADCGLYGEFAGAGRCGEFGKKI